MPGVVPIAVHAEGYTQARDSIGLLLSPDKCSLLWSSLQSTQRIPERPAMDGDLFQCRLSGVMFDFPKSTALAEFTANFSESGKIISVVSHGLASLLEVKLNNGDYLTKDISLTRHWVFALDIGFQTINATLFSGTTKVGVKGEPAIVGKGYRNLFSIAPAVEYNFNQHVGLIAGLGLSLRDKNTSEFFGVVAALYLFL